MQGVHQPGKPVEPGNVRVSAKVRQFRENSENRGKVREFSENVEIQSKCITLVFRTTKNTRIPVKLRLDGKHCSGKVR